MINLKSNDEIFQTITESITEDNISELNLEIGKEYLISMDKDTHKLSLEQDINKVIYIKKIIFQNVSDAKEYLTHNTVFERLMSDDDININSEFFDDGQLKRINYGIEYDLDIVYFAKPCFDVSQMSVIIDGLVNFFYIDLYASPKFNFDQMYVIYDAFRKKWKYQI
jgi:hypothetical protein